MRKLEKRIQELELENQLLKKKYDVLEEALLWYGDHSNHCPGGEIDYVCGTLAWSAMNRANAMKVTTDAGT